MEKLKIIFMGTPEFGATILKELIKVHDVVLVVTQTDKYKGKKVLYNPVKEVAISNNIPVFQPVNIRKDNEEIFLHPCDLIVTAAYGQIVGTKVLDFPKYKSINVHGSLLPKYRGGAPIQRAIMNGDKETGITIMYMAKGMDSGDILAMEKIDILDMTSSELFIALANLGAKMINETIEKLIWGKIEPIKQDEALVTYAYNLTKEDELIDFNKDALTLYNQIRGLSTNPGAYFIFDNMVYKVYNSIVVKDNSNKDVSTILKVNKDGIVIKCKEDAIMFNELKPEGKKLMSVKDYLNGNGKNIFKENRRIYE